MEACIGTEEYRKNLSISSEPLIGSDLGSLAREFFPIQNRFARRNSTFSEFTRELLSVRREEGDDPEFTDVYKPPIGQLQFRDDRKGDKGERHKRIGKV
jgi:hypothetical protein